MKLSLDDRILSPVELICKVDGLPMPVAEFKFHPERKWRFDWCWPHFKIALEIEGGVFTSGRHTRGKGFLEDIDKYNSAVALGWKLFRCTPKTIHLVMIKVENVLANELLREASR